MEGLKNANVDISFILQQKSFTPRKLRNVNEKTTVVHGCDIQLLSPAWVFLEKIILTLELIVQRTSDPRKEQTLKRKEDGNNKENICRRHPTDAAFVFNFEKCVYFIGQAGSGRFGVPTIIIIKKQ